MGRREALGPQDLPAQEAQRRHLVAAHTSEEQRPRRLEVERRLAACRGALGRRLVQQMAANTWEEQLQSQVGHTEAACREALGHHLELRAPKQAAARTVGRP